MIFITSNDIGRRVIYRKKDRGVVTSLSEAPASGGNNNGTVFVRYDFQHPQASGQATNMCDLEWENPK